MHNVIIALLLMLPPRVWRSVPIEFGGAVPDVCSDRYGRNRNVIGCNGASAALNLRHERSPAIDRRGCRAGRQSGARQYPDNSARRPRADRDGTRLYRWGIAANREWAPRQADREWAARRPQAGPALLFSAPVA